MAKKFIVTLEQDTTAENLVGALGVEFEGATAEEFPDLESEKPAEQPPADNDHVAEGCEKFTDEAKTAEQAA